MSHQQRRSLELQHRRDEILKETANVTSSVVRSLEQQQTLGMNTDQQLKHQNLVLAQANDKMRAMNKDLSAVVDEMNEMETRGGCLGGCRKSRKGRKDRQRRRDEKERSIQLTSPVLQQLREQVDRVGGPKGTGMTSGTSTPHRMPELVKNNELERQIIAEMNLMKDQMLMFRDQIREINVTLQTGDNIIEQVTYQTNEYMVKISVALTKAEQLLGRKFILSQEQHQAIAKERAERHPRI
ncbi:unnamed protein product [Didymodactylos carnosus]|uniref:Uncharacterized protein n=1 Tax=Didymodactylos carnosus TaxID=1234261 RepID=A0A814E3J3_9BILA|nr:unnamed protein product [Didymodactylos carnosus]CAF0962026.1 unnamed protein product [Didymodactylos carnosus]CAF3598933.1 unnamed protein product [Didymodactylos carnosus]CAF3736464.1 unnamed protein product [Didymodactylos carnosus]